MSDPPALDPLAGRCGRCAWLHSVRLDAARNENMGECGNGVWPVYRPEKSTCPLYVPEGQLRSAPPNPGRTRTNKPAVAGRDGPRRAPVEIEIDMDENTFRSVLREILNEELGLSDTAIGERWKGGELVLKPGNATQEKRMPLEAFFHKIVMVRDKLRVLEQKINASDKLADDEKVTLQQYVTGVYGSLTSFNVLFRDDEDRFSGAKERE